MDLLLRKCRGRRAGYDCAQCGQHTVPGQAVHTIVHCALTEAGWTPEKIEANLQATFEAMRRIGAE